jgi:glutathione S-transferase
VAVARYFLQHLEMTEARRVLLAEKQDKGRAALAVMEDHLATRTYFVGERPTIADLALYAYTHVADEGGYDLEPYPAVRAWLARVTAEPGHIPITQG